MPLKGIISKPAVKILFASQNPHKIKEVSSIMPQGIEVIGTDSLGFTDEIIEDADSLEGNALIKARTLVEKFKLPCFADDTGLFIESLSGQPGVYSARWSNLEPEYPNNIEKALKLLEDKEDRRAHFKTVIAFIENGKEYLFEGRVDGKMLQELRGEGGFGYDPLFVPDGYSESFAEMPSEEKNRISHRALAIQKFISFLKDRDQG